MSDSYEERMLEALRDAYLRGDIGTEDFEHDTARVLRGERPERCSVAPDMSNRTAY